MVITQTPLRISFFGGGTDFRGFFEQEDGCVLSSAIDRYIFVIIKRRFDDKIRVAYTKTELVDRVDDVEHELVRECLRRTGLTKRLEIATMGDIPSSGSGMGSSSTVTVGLLNAMYQYQGRARSADALAREACEIEIEILKKPIGLQDQYIAAHGGQRLISFRAGGVCVEPLGLDETECRRLGQNLLLFYTSMTRKAESVLSEQVDNMGQRLEVLRQMKRLALTARECLRSGEYDEFGFLLHDGWQLKKQMASKVSNGAIDDLYSLARNAGALGGKITGAGGGGFLLVYCPPHRQSAVRSALHRLPELPFSLEPAGSKVIFNYPR